MAIKKLFLAMSIVKSVFNCRLSGVIVIFFVLKGSLKDYFEAENSKKDIVDKNVLLSNGSKMKTIHYCGGAYI